jgi:hypothetical protein
VVEIGNGTEIVALHDAMPEETMRTDRPGETETYLMIEGAEVDDVVIGATAMADLEAELSRSARKAQALHPRRRNQHQT